MASKAAIRLREFRRISICGYACFRAEACIFVAQLNEAMQFLWTGSCGQHASESAGKNCLPFFWRDQAGEQQRCPIDELPFASDGSPPVPATWGNHRDHPTDCAS
ncbi:MULTISPECIES: hypothetical protein [Bradyrhizobium]|uniref:hypothetical protein n=1 Tax=Bradyrhizobium TaxID=374 RepID=UPI001EDC50A8|nr:hypothetical protein [Bradyrhizobium zhengyangense]MCG2645334.1 hypothetical protein [Bradyrhizobium zhengyangense]